jgi:hypothetical protein
MSLSRLFAFVEVKTRNGDLSPTSPNFYPAPVGVLPVPELHSLIAIEVNAQFRVIILRKLKPERLDSLPVRCKYDQMIRVQVQAVGQHGLFVGPADRLLFINP